MEATWFPFGAWTSAPPWGDRARPTAMRTSTSWDRLAARLTTHPPAPDLPWSCTDKRCRARRPSRWRRPGTCPRCHTAPLGPDKSSLPAWSAWTFEGPNRERPRAMSALVLDYDGGSSLAALRDRWAPWAHAAHTSWSHEADADARARVVLPLAAPIDVALWPRVWAWALARDPAMDRSCDDAGRLFYLPFARAGRPAGAWRHEGPRLDVDRLTLPEPSPRARGDAPAPRSSWGELSADRRARAAALREDPMARFELARAVKARLRGEGVEQRAVAAPCPGCGEPSVWFWIQPRALRGCRCVHEKSCGWTGWLDELAP